MSMKVSQSLMIKGVIGQVVSVGKTSSRVLLITDVSHALPVRVLRNDLRAIASGTGNINELTLKNLPKKCRYSGW